MLQEDSNGENTFEIIEKRLDDGLLTDKTESISSMSSSASLLPSPSVSITSVPGGNLLSNVAPPTALPNFIPSVPQVASSTVKTSIVEKRDDSAKCMTPSKSQPVLNVVPPAESYQTTQFSAAIPPSKGIQHGVAYTVEPQVAEQHDSGGLISWMKGAVSSGGLLSKVAEKAKSSVDSMITTLDPQMREYIYSGGDLDILVASGQEVKISAVREAFQVVFGKATVTGVVVESTSIAPQPVGFAAGVKAAEEKIQKILMDPKIQQNPAPVIAIENFILEVGEDKWYDLDVLILVDPIKQINFQTFTQMTPIPAAVVTSAQEDTPKDFPLRWSGLKVPIGGLISSSLQVSRSEWHQSLTGVSHREIILLAAKSLAKLYKNIIRQDN